MQMMEWPWVDHFYPHRVCVSSWRVFGEDINAGVVKAAGGAVILIRFCASNLWTVQEKRSS